MSLHVKYRYSCQILMKVVFPRQIFEKCSFINCHENLFSGSRVVICTHTHAHIHTHTHTQRHTHTRARARSRSQRRTKGWAGGQTEMTKLIVAFSNFANPPKKTHFRTYLQMNCLLCFGVVDPPLKFVPALLILSLYCDNDKRSKTILEKGRAVLVLFQINIRPTKNKINKGLS